MSEYQYYEFVAIDRPLDDMDYNWVRGLSNRAELSRTRFVNSYYWGDFNGDPNEMLERCFDAYLYISNFGICHIAFKLPPGSIELRQAKQYSGECGCSIRKTKNGIIVCFAFDDEPGEWDHCENDANWMGALLPIRDELLRGDLRSLYIAWLTNVRYEAFDPGHIEPNVPPGLRQLTAAQSALASFLMVGDTLIKIAAKSSEPRPAQSLSERRLKTYVSKLERSTLEKSLVRVLEGEGDMVRREHLRTIEASAAIATEGSRKRRKVSAIHSEWSKSIVSTT